MSKAALPEAYDKLREVSEEAHLLSTTASLVSWDQETGLPPDAVPYRARQSAYLAGKQHALMTSNKVGQWISACEDAALPKQGDAAKNVQEWRRQYDRNAKLPKKLVEEFEETKALSQAVWVDARAKSDFSLFQPHLEKIISLRRHMADAWGYADHPYDSLLEEYE
ncbi:MAG: carboxypeptidase M32, partial [Verrucomicrobiota bacterium]